MIALSLSSGRLRKIECAYSYGQQHHCHGKYLRHMADLVRPDAESVEAIFRRSYCLWSSYAQDLHVRLPATYCDLRSLLGRVPAFPCDLRQPKGQTSAPKYHYTRSTLRISGQSLWKISAGECESPPKQLHHDLPCGFIAPVTCCLARSSRCTNWHVFEEDRHQASGRHITIIILAWAYILSARWVELQRPASRLLYSEHKAERLGEREDTATTAIVIHVGTATQQCIRWWAALLAPSQGWRAEIDVEVNVYQSPWSTCITTPHRLAIKSEIQRPAGGQSEEVPPSSDKALIYLQEYCELHAISNQHTAALAAVLFFPWKNSDGDSVVLPLPEPQPSHSTATQHRPLSNPPDPVGCIQSHYHRLVYYMTLSCNVRGLRALLSGSFFEPDVPCNLVGPWIQPIFEIIDGQDLEGLAIIMGRRQPALAALWFGAIMLGLETSVLQSVQIGLFPVEPNAAAWTGTIQSFINVLPPRIYSTLDKEIDRADECRLLYLIGSESYQRFPVSPWRPFGSTPLIYTELEVQRHATCKGHTLQYLSWGWDTNNGCSCEDYGLDEKITPAYHWDAMSVKPDLTHLHNLEDRLRDHAISETATRSIFGWLRMDGYPPTERSIFTHDWFDTGSSSEGSACSDDDNSDPKLSSVATWLDDLVYND